MCITSVLRRIQYLFRMEITQSVTAIDLAKEGEFKASATVVRDILLDLDTYYKTKSTSGYGSVFSSKLSASKLATEVRTRLTGTLQSAWQAFQKLDLGERAARVIVYAVFAETVSDNINLLLFPKEPDAKYFTSKLADVKLSLQKIRPLRPSRVFQPAEELRILRVIATYTNTLLGLMRERKHPLADHPKISFTADVARLNIAIESIGDESRLAVFVVEYGLAPPPVVTSTPSSSPISTNVLTVDVTLLNDNYTFIEQTLAELEKNTETAKGWNEFWQGRLVTIADTLLSKRNKRFGEEVKDLNGAFWFNVYRNVLICLDLLSRLVSTQRANATLQTFLTQLSGFGITGDKDLLSKEKIQAILPVLANSTVLCKSIGFYTQGSIVS